MFVLYLADFAPALTTSQYLRLLVIAMIQMVSGPLIYGALIVIAIRHRLETVDIMGERSLPILKDLAVSNAAAYARRESFFEKIFLGCPGCRPGVHSHVLVG
jgi:hypothetical protein